MKAIRKSFVYGDDDVPLEALKYSVTPRLVTLLTFALDTPASGSLHLSHCP